MNSADELLEALRNLLLPASPAVAAPPSGPGRKCTVCLDFKGEDKFRKRPSGSLRAACYECEKEQRKERWHRGKETAAPEPTKVAAVAPEQPLRDRILAAIRTRPIEIRALATSCGVAPGEVIAEVERARADSIAVRITGAFVALGVDEAEERIQSIGVVPTTGDVFRCAVISDTHLGSKYCLRAQLREFIEHAYSLGVREILHPGDVLDGCYRHSEFEVSHVGLDEQARDLLETLPALPGLRYHAITGNHDHTFTERGGVEVGGYLTRYFKDRGRDDLRFYGNRSAFLRIGGAVVHLWHPLGSGSYARSYKLQKQVEKYASGEKPHLLLVGHYHTYCAIFERGVHALLCPTFQGGGSQFGKALGGSPAIGGMILEWSMTAHGTMRSFKHDYRAYFERERPQQIEDDQGWRQEVG